MCTIPTDPERALRDPERADFFPSGGRQSITFRCVTGTRISELGWCIPADRFKIVGCGEGRKRWFQGLSQASCNRCVYRIQVVNAQNCGPASHQSPQNDHLGSKRASWLRGFDERMWGDPELVKYTTRISSCRNVAK